MCLGCSFASDATFYEHFLTSSSNSNSTFRLAPFLQASLVHPSLQLSPSRGYLVPAGGIKGRRTPLTVRVLNPSASLPEDDRKSLLKGNIHLTMHTSSRVCRTAQEVWGLWSGRLALLFQKDTGLGFPLSLVTLHQGRCLNQLCQQH